MKLRNLHIIIMASFFMFGCNDNKPKKDDEYIKTSFVSEYTQTFIQAEKTTQAKEDKKDKQSSQDMMFVLSEKADIFDPTSSNKIGSIYEGSAVKVLEDRNDFMLVSINGEANQSTLSYKANDDNLFIYLNLDNKMAENSMSFLIKKTDLTHSLEQAWEKTELMYYDACTSCHSAHKPNEHTMDEWDAYVGAMQMNAKISDEQKDKILRFMQAYASDGVFKQ